MSYRRGLAAGGGMARASGSVVLRASSVPSVVRFGYSPGFGVAGAAAHGTMDFMTESQPALRRELNLRDLVLFNIAAVVGIRWLAAAARSGPGSFSLWLMAAAFFFIPSALAVSALARKYPEEGGIYTWTKQSFGDWHGFLCGWCYWLSNLFYFPNLLLAGISMAVYTFGAGAVHLADNRGFVILVSLAVLWIVLLTNLMGVAIGKWTANAGGMATYGAGLILVLVGLAALVRYGSVTPFHPLPKWNLETVNFWSQIAFAFGGLELGAVMGGEIRNPGVTVRRAAWISGFAIAGFYILGTVAVLALLRPGDINVVTGLAQAGAAASQRFGINWLAPLIAILITLGVAGQLAAWLSGGARLPFVIGIDHYLPPAFARLHPRWHTPHVAILTQGIACSVFLVLMQLGENLRTGYQLLVDMTVITYFIPFLYLFASAWRHGLRWSGITGFLTTTIAILISFVPPAESGSTLLFEAKLAGGCVLLVVAGRMAFAKGRRAMSAAQA